MARKRDDTGMRSRLMEAAMSAFAKKGLDQCTMGDIATEAGLATGTAYLYFKGKEQLMLLMYRHYARHMLDYQLQRLAQAETDGPREKLQLACDECLRAALRHRKTFSLWFQFLALGSSPERKQKVREILAENYRGHGEYVEALLREGIRLGEFRSDINVRAIGAALIAVLEGFLIREYASPDLINLEEDYREITGTLLDSITAIPART